MGTQLLLREWGRRGLTLWGVQGWEEAQKGGKCPLKWSKRVLNLLCPLPQGPRGLPGERGRPGPSGPAVSIWDGQG